MIENYVRFMGKKKKNLNEAFPVERANEMAQAC